MKYRLDQLFKIKGYSRRQYFALIQASSIRVNTRVVSSMTEQVDLSRDRIFLNGKRQFLSVKTVVYKFHKPKDVISTMQDPKGRRSVVDFLNTLEESVFPVGRLDRATSGLLLFTNDGALVEKLLHPRYSCVKKYRLTLSKSLTKNDFLRLQEGIMLEDGPVFLKQLTYEGKFIDLSISEGRNRVIRRLFSTLGYEVVQLKRYAFAGIEMGDLKLGSFSKLSLREYQLLIKTCDYK